VHLTLENPPKNVVGLLRFVGLSHLRRYVVTPTPEAQAHKAFYEAQITKISSLQPILNSQSPDEAKQSLFSRSSVLWEAIKVFIVETLPSAIGEGPFIGGIRPGVDDFHVGAWIARIAFVLGAHKSEEGLIALDRIFEPIPEKVEEYWTAWIGRESWVKAYPNNNLH
jgi:hypothetical protein